CACAQAAAMINAINSSHSSVHAPNRGYSTPGVRTSRMVTTAERAAAVRARTRGMAVVSSHGAKALGGGHGACRPGIRKAAEVMENGGTYRGVPRQSARVPEWLCRVFCVGTGESVVSADPCRVSVG